MDALEYFGDYEDWGRGGKFIPKHNAYTPAPTIMPIPKFEDYETEDDYGKSFTYRTKENNYTSSPLIKPDTMKPTPFEPKLPKEEDPFFLNHWERRRYKLDKWTKKRGLSKSKRQAWKAPQLPTRWGFSSRVSENISPEEEDKLIREYDQAHAQKQVQINIRQCVLQPLSNLNQFFGSDWTFFGRK